MLPVIHCLTRYALFFDFDGTLANIADQPTAVRMDEATLRNIEKIQNKSNDALAVVTGREIVAIDAFFAPLRVPVVGVHGLERRDASGRIHRVSTDVQAFEAMANSIRLAIANEPGLILEVKNGAIALHFRQRPELETHCHEIMDGVTRNRPDLAMMRGKMVFEVKLKGADKGTGIAAFLDEPPFRGRVPVFAGDDFTDETGFAVVNACGGVSIKIGPEQTLAHFRAANIEEFKDWLERLASGVPKEKYE